MHTKKNSYVQSHVAIGVVDVGRAVHFRGKIMYSTEDYTHTFPGFT